MKKIFFTFTILIFICCQFIFAQNPPAAKTGSSGPFNIGERLTYNISFSNFNTAAYAETYVVSQGKYGTRDAVYLQGKFKTTDLVSAAFFSVDETRQTLVASDTGMPLLCKRIFNEGGFAREKLTDLKGAAAGFDWLSAIYHLRFAGNTDGSFAIQEGDQVFQATYRMVGSAHNKTGAGEFDTVVLEVQNPTFPGLRVHISTDEQRLPVIITYKHPKGMIRAELAGIQELAPEPVVALTPQTTPTPVTAATPKPRPTPTPYKNNQPLAEELPFDIGETLTYRLTRPGSANSFGTMAVQAKERRLFFSKDSLLLNVTVQEINEANSFFMAGDSVKSYVDPESLLPQRSEIVFKGALSTFNQVLNFDQTIGKVNDNRAAVVDIPVGTHDILSLAYAIRSFNLKDAKGGKAPGLDTRVALYTSDGPVILTILPQPEEFVDYQGKKIATQVVFTNVGQTQVKLWLSKDADRLPLRLSIASPTFSFIADLVSVTQITPAEDATGSPAGISGIPASPILPTRPL